MPKIEKLEYEKRIRIVQEWILEDWPSCDIIVQINQAWKLECRQAKRYISEARKRWNNDEEDVIDQKRKLKVASLKKLKRSLKAIFTGTPAGIRAIVAIEKEIIQLEGLRKPTKIDLTQPLSPATNLSDTQFQQLLIAARESKNHPGQ